MSREHQSTSLRLATASFYLMAAQCVGYMVEDFSSCPEKAAAEIHATQFRMWYSEHHWDNSEGYLQLPEIFESVRQVWDSYRKATDFTKGFLRMMSFFSLVCEWEIFSLTLPFSQAWWERMDKPSLLDAPSSSAELAKGCNNLLLL